MKKIAIMAVLLLSATYTISAQVSTDTIPVNYKGYHYTNWYCGHSCFVDDGWVDSCHRVFFVPSIDATPRVNWQYAKQPLKVKGLAAITRYNSYPVMCYNNDRVAEYLYLYQYDSTITECDYSYKMPMIMLDSVRFDTAAPKIMLLPRYLNDTTPHSAIVYEGYFKSPIVVDSSFYIMASRNNNLNDGGIYAHIPFWYVNMEPYFNYKCSSTNIDEFCPPALCHTAGYSPFGDEPYFYHVNGKDYIGFYFPIVDKYNIEVLSADSTTGSVSGGGLIPDGWVDTLRAFPAAGYEFTHWDDGNTDNPRLITVMGDSVFTAVFEATDRTYTVTLDVNNPSWGSVEGAGSYPVYQQVEIRAVAANDTFAFVGWSDANWQNPRTITLTRDTSFTANFQRVLAVEESGTQASLFAEIRPNPASGSVRIDVKAEGRCRAEFIDAAGRVRYARSFDAPSADIDISLLQPGAWIVRITTPAGTTHRRLVVK